MFDYIVFDLMVRFRQQLSVIGGWLGEHLPNIIIILIVAWMVRKFGSRVISRILRRTLRRDLFPTEIDRKKRVQTLDRLVSAILRIAVWIVAFIMIVDELGINTAPLLASAGVLGVALGFGAQSLIKDFVSGVFIISENQYRIGDVVRLDTVSGVVEAITIRTTVLRDLDGNVHHVPNGAITITTNMTLGYAQVNENILVSYGTDIAKLEKVINTTGQKLAAMPEYKDKIIEPPHFERIDQFSDRGIMVKILARTVPGEQWGIKGQLFRMLTKAFEANNINIALPKFMLNDGPWQKEPEPKVKPATPSKK